MKKRLFAIALLTLSLFSCNKDKIEIDPDNLLIGTWKISGYETDVTVYERSGGFVDDHCYRFNPDGTLTERKIDGWCGTPPVTYANYSGTWSIVNDTLITITAGYWGGEMTYRFDIESVDDEYLRVRVIYE